MLRCHASGTRLGPHHETSICSARGSCIEPRDECLTYTGSMQHMHMHASTRSYLGEYVNVQYQLEVTLSC